MTDAEYARLGIRLREVRGQRGFSLQELAEKTDLRKNTIQSIELGRSKPSLDMIVTLVQALEVSLDYLVLGIRPRTAGWGLVLHCDDDPEAAVLSEIGSPASPDDA